MWPQCGVGGLPHTISVPVGFGQFRRAPLSEFMPYLRLSGLVVGPGIRSRIISGFIFGLLARLRVDRPGL
jgi:hypothetical protein